MPRKCRWINGSLTKIWELHFNQQECLFCRFDVNVIECTWSVNSWQTTGKMTQRKCLSLIWQYIPDKLRQNNVPNV